MVVDYIWEVQLYMILPQTLLPHTLVNVELTYLCIIRGNGIHIQWVDYQPSSTLFIITSTVYFMFIEIY